MEDESGTDRRKAQIAKELETYDRKLRQSPLMSQLRADGWIIEDYTDVPDKQRGQLYRSQLGLHYGTTDKYNTLLGNILERDRSKRLQVNKIASDAVKHAPPTISATMEQGMADLDTSRGAMNQTDFYERLSPYRQATEQNPNPTTWDPTVEDEFVASVVRVCNKLEKETSMILPTDLANYMEWKAQITSGTNSGSYKWESLVKEQWVSTDIPNLLEQMDRVVKGKWSDEFMDYRTTGIYTLFGRTPNRPVHAVAMFEKAMGAKLNYDLTRSIGKSPDSNIAWMSLDTMLQRMGEGMAEVESTIHEDFKRFDSYVSPDLSKAILEGFLQSDWLKSQPENRNIMEYLMRQLSNPTWLLMHGGEKALMRGSLYSGTPITQIFGSILHLAYIDMLKQDHGFNTTDHMVLSDDGFCTFDGPASEAQSYVMDTMIPQAARIGMILNPKKSYVADITKKKVMYNSDGDKIVRHDVGPMLQKFAQINPDHAFGNVPRLIRSLKGRERDFERDSYQMLFQLLPSLRLTERGDRAQLVGWVQDFWRTIEVLAQVRPGYPRVREMIRSIVKVYPGFWKKFDMLVTAAEASGDVLFDTAARRGGGSSEKGTTRWLVNYLLEVRSTKSWPQMAEKYR